MTANHKRRGFTPFQNPQAPKEPRGVEPCSITFAWDPGRKRIGLLFGGAITSLVFDVEDAEKVAQQLIWYVKAARGETPAVTGKVTP